MKECKCDLLKFFSPEVKEGRRVNHLISLFEHQKLFFKEADWLNLALCVQVLFALPLVVVAPPPKKKTSGYMTCSVLAGRTVTCLFWGGARYKPSKASLWKVKQRNPFLRCLFIYSCVVYFYQCSPWKLILFPTSGRRLPANCR